MTITPKRDETKLFLWWMRQANPNRDRNQSVAYLWVWYT